MGFCCLTTAMHQKGVWPWSDKLISRPLRYVQTMLLTTKMCVSLVGVPCLVCLHVCLPLGFHKPG